MPRTQVPITGTVLDWAIKESGWTEEQLAHRLKVDVERLRAWREEREHPSKTEFNHLVAALRRPSALFFMPEPPEAEAITAQFRSAPGVVGHVLTESETRALRRAHGIRELLGWVLEQQGKPPIELPRLDPARSPEAAGQELRRKWGPSFGEQLAWRKADDAFKAYRNLLEDVGIFVLQFEIRKSKMRGFSFWDPHAPLVVVKSGFNYPSRIFTLFHEVGHTLTRSESACHGFVDPAADADPQIERWCERFASAYLLPREEVEASLASRWGIYPGRTVDDFDLVMDIAGAFKVSGRALAIQLIRWNYADHDLYNLVDSRARIVDQPEEGGFARGGRRPRKRLREYGSRAPAILVDAFEAREINRKDALAHLNVNLSELRELERLLAEE